MNFAPLDNSTSLTSSTILPSGYNLGDLQVDYLCSSDNEHVSSDRKVTEMKESLIQIVNDKHHEISMEKESENHQEMVDLVKNYKKHMSCFSKIQDELVVIDIEFQKEIHEVEKRIKQMDAMISFMKQNEQIDADSPEKLVQTIIDNMNTLSSKIIENDTIKEIKQKYSEKKKELQPYLHLIGEINQWNHSNICPLCLTNPVDHYINPCGHTYCKECLEIQLKEDTIPEINQSYNRNNHTCSFCRKTIQSINKLYFL